MVPKKVKKRFPKYDIFAILHFLAYAVPLLYFMVYTTIIYHFVGDWDVLILIPIAGLLMALYWGFADIGRVFISSMILLLIAINFFLGGMYAATFFLFSPLIFYSTRDWGPFVLIGLILFNLYTAYHYNDDSSRKTSSFTMLKHYSSFLLNVPDYDENLDMKGLSRRDFLMESYNQTERLDIRFFHHVAIHDEGDTHYYIVGEESVEGHPEYERLKKASDKLNKKWRKK